MRKWSILAGLLLVLGACDLEGPDEMALVLDNPDALDARTPHRPLPTERPGDASPIHETYIHASTKFVPGARSAFRIVVAQAESLTRVTPIARARVTVTLRQDGKTIAHVMTARTNANGTVSRSVKFPKVEEGQYDLVVNTSSKYGTDEVTSPVTVSDATQILLLTDKPIYQPSQMIHLRALALHRFDLTPADGAKVQLVIEDAKGNRVFKRKITAGEYGEVFTDFLLANEVNEGIWQITATLGDTEVSKSITVKKYVLPKFKIDVDAGQAFFKPGDTVRGKIDVAYFFGKPVTGGDVTIIASKFDVGFHEFQRLTGKTDSDGTFDFEMDLPTTFHGQPLASGDALWKLEVTVRDKAQQLQRSVKTYPVAANGFRVTLIPESGKLVPAVPNEIWVLATDPSGEPVANTAVEITLGKQKARGKTDEAGITRLTVTPAAALFNGAPNGRNAVGVRPTVARWRCESKRLPRRVRRSARPFNSAPKVRARRFFCAQTALFTGLARLQKSKS